MYWVAFIPTYLPTYLPTWLSVYREIFLRTREERKYLSCIASLLTLQSCFISGTFACCLLWVNWIIASHGCIEVIHIGVQFHKNSELAIAI